MDKIKFAAIDPNKDYVLPTKKDGDAGYDVYASFTEDNMIIEPLTTKLIPTNLAYLLPEGFHFMVEERGSTGSKGIKKSAGVCDESYRGELFIAITNCNDKPVVITKEEDTAALEADYIVYPYKKAIAQLILEKTYDAETELVPYDEILKVASERGTGALGSSGK